MAENENSKRAIRQSRMAMLISPCEMSAIGGYGLAGSQNGHGACGWVYQRGSMGRGRRRIQIAITCGQSRMAMTRQEHKENLNGRK